MLSLGNWQKRSGSLICIPLNKLCRIKKKKCKNEDILNWKIHLPWLQLTVQFVLSLVTLPKSVDCDDEWWTCGAVSGPVSLGQCFMQVKVLSPCEGWNFSPRSHFTPRLYHLDFPRRLACSSTGCLSSCCDRGIMPKDVFTLASFRSAQLKSGLIPTRFGWDRDFWWGR